MRYELFCGGLRGGEDLSTLPERPNVERSRVREIELDRDDVGAATSNSLPSPTPSVTTLGMDEEMCATLGRTSLVVWRYIGHVRRPL